MKGLWDVATHLKGMLMSEGVRVLLGCPKLDILLALSTALFEGHNPDLMNLILDSPRLTPQHMFDGLNVALDSAIQMAPTIIAHPRFDRGLYDGGAALEQAITKPDQKAVEFLLQNRLADPTAGRCYVFFHLWTTKQHALGRLVRKYVLASGNQHAMDLVNNHIIEHGYATMMAGKKKAKAELIKYAATYKTYWAPLNFVPSESFLASLAIPLPAPQGEEEKVGELREAQALVRTELASIPQAMAAELGMLEGIIGSLQTIQHLMEKVLFHAFLDHSEPVFGTAGFPRFGAIELLFSSFDWMISNFEKTYKLAEKEVQNVAFLRRSIGRFVEQFKLAWTVSGLIEEGAAAQLKQLLSTTFDQEVAQMKIGQVHAYYLTIHNHVAVGTFCKTAAASGAWTVFNSGAPRDPKTRRQPLYKRYYNVPCAWVSTLMKKLTVDASRIMDVSVIYPAGYPMKAARTSIVGQRAGSCKVKSIWNLALYTLGRPCYTKLKLSSNLTLLDSVYAMQASPSTGMTVFDKSFQSAYMPVWSYVRDSRIIERRLHHQIARLPSLPAHLDDDTEGTVSLEEVQQAQAECSTILSQHCAKHDIIL